MTSRIYAFSPPLQPIWQTNVEQYHARKLNRNNFRGDACIGLLQS